MASPALDNAIAELPEADRRVFRAVLEVVEYLIAQVDALAKALAGLDLLDDLRASQIAEVRAMILSGHAEHSVRAGEPAQCLCGSGDAKEAAHAATCPVYLAWRREYQAEIRALRERREADDGA